MKTSTSKSQQALEIVKQNWGDKPIPALICDKLGDGSDHYQIDELSARNFHRVMTADGYKWDKSQERWLKVKTCVSFTTTKNLGFDQKIDEIEATQNLKYITGFGTRYSSGIIRYHCVFRILESA